MLTRCCWECKKISFIRGTEGCPAYSEVTPGYEGTQPELLCEEGHWSVEFTEDTQEQFRQKIMSAETCSDFVQYTPATACRR